MLTAEANLDLDIEGAINNVTTSSNDDSLRDIHAPEFLVQFITHIKLIHKKTITCFLLLRLRSVAVLVWGDS